MSLGKQHESKPVTASDKIMSKRHLKHRAIIDEMKTNGTPKKKYLEKSVEYNKAHLKEHQKALKKAAKQLEKAYK